jgi:hypothetical protein
LGRFRSGSIIYSKTPNAELRTNYNHRARG